MEKLLSPLGCVILLHFPFYSACQYHFGCYCTIFPKPPDVCECIFEFWLKVDWFCQQHMVSEHLAYLPMSQYPECQDQTQLMSITLKSMFWFLRNFIPLRIKGFIGSKKMVLNSSDQRLWKKWVCCPPHPQFRILFRASSV